MAKQKRMKRVRRPIPEAVQREQLFKVFSEQTEKLELPEGAFLFMIDAKEPIAQHYKTIAEGFTKIDRKDALVVVTEDFENIKVFTREEMREAGWLWVGPPRSEKIDGEYWEHLREISYKIQEMTGMVYTELMVGAFLYSYQSLLQRENKLLESAWKRARIAHPDLENWSIPIAKTTTWDRIKFKAWNLVRKARNR